MLKTHEFTDSVSLVTALSDAIKDSLAAQPNPSLWVSGGSTPKPLFEALSRRDDIAWDTVTLGLVDERYLPADHADANAGLVAAHLHKDAAAQAQFLPVFDPALDAGAQAALLDQAWRAPLSRAAAMVLGMGNDMHTASIFPGLPETPDLLDPVGTRLVSACHPQTAPHARVTLTLPAIMQAKRLFLHIQGAEKRLILTQAMQAKDPNLAPISAFVNHPQMCVELYWCP